MKQKTKIEKTFKQLMAMNVTDLQKEIKSTAKTVNTRLRYNRKKGDNLRFSNWYRLSGGKQILEDANYSTKNGFLKEGYTQKKDETNFNYKKRLVRILLNYNKGYNFDFRYETVEDYMEEWARRIGADVQVLKDVIEFTDSNDVMDELFRIYGSEIIAIINERMSQGESYDSIMWDLRKLIVKYNHDLQSIMDEFSNYGELLL